MKCMTSCALALSAALLLGAGEAFAEALALVAFEAQDLGKVVADALFVVDDQNRAG